MDGLGGGPPLDFGGGVGTTDEGDCCAWEFPDEMADGVQRVGSAILVALEIAESNFPILGDFGIFQALVDPISPHLSGGLDFVCFVGGDAGGDEKDFVVGLAGEFGDGEVAVVNGIEASWENGNFWHRDVWVGYRFMRFSIQSR